jgi:hypothetical protein
MQLRILLPTMSMLYCPMAHSDDLPTRIFGTWYEPTGVEGECRSEILEIVRTRSGDIQVSGRSGDWVCTWRDGRIISRVIDRSVASGQLTVIFFKSQCEQIDDRKYPPGSTVLTYVQRQGSEGKIGEEELFIGSVKDAYSGFYKRCREGKR